MMKKCYLILICAIALSLAARGQSQSACAAGHLMPADGGEVRAAVYCDRVGELESYSFRGSDGSVLFDSRDANAPLRNGYQIVELRESQNPIELALAFKGAVEPWRVCLNGEPLTGLGQADGIVGGELWLREADVLKIFAAAEPRVCTVSFVREETEAVVVVDRVREINPYGVFEFFAGTEIEISTSGEVIVNGKLLQGEQERYAFVVTANAEVMIAPTGTSPAITADQRQEKAYNLQGIEMRGPMPPGIYAIGGRLVFKR